MEDKNVPAQTGWLGPSPNEILSFWANAPGAGMTFDAGDGAAAQAPVWRTNLPADPREAEKILSQGENRWAQIDSALGQAESRLAIFQATAGRIQVMPGTPVSFDVPNSQALPPPERELLGMLRGVEQAQQPESFGPVQDLAGRVEWSQASQELESFLERLTQIITLYAWVETSVDGQLLGRTAVTWTGDMQTTWREDLSPSQAPVHYRALALALTSRNSLLRTLSLAGRGAMMLAALPALLATPGGALLALPAAWKFINQVLHEFEEAPPHSN